MNYYRDINNGQCFILEEASQTLIGINKAVVGLKIMASEYGTGYLVPMTSEEIRMTTKELALNMRRMKDAQLIKA